MSYLQFIGKKYLDEDFIKNKDCLKHFLSFLCLSKGIKEIEQWYLITRKDVEDLGGKNIFTHYNNLIEILNFVYDYKYKFYEWKFIFVNRGFWRDELNCKNYMDWLFNELKFKNMEDWYKINTDSFYNNHGTTLLYLNKGCPQNLIKKYYPKYDWIPWKFERVPKNFWSDVNNQRKYTDWLFNELKFKNMEDWYNINQEIIQNNFGASVLNYYKGSPQKMLEKIYSEIKWIPYKFNLPKGFWKDINNQKEYMDWLFKELKYEKEEDWYKLQRYMLNENYGSTLKNIYRTIYELISSVYPKIDWIPYKFNKLPSRFLNKFENHKKIIDFFEKEYNIKKEEDWYNINRENFRQSGLISLLHTRHYSGLEDLLSKIYPDYKWDTTKFPCYKTEIILSKFLSEHDEDLIWGYKPKWCRHPDTNFICEYDFYLPKFNLIIELDGEQHFNQVSNWKSPQEVQKRDLFKMKKANDRNISIIRLLQDDVYKNKNNWKEKLEIYIKKYEEVKVIYIGEKYENFIKIE